MDIELVFSLVTILGSLVAAISAMKSFFLKKESEDEYLEVLKKNKGRILKILDAQDKSNGVSYETLLPEMKDIALQIKDKSHKEAIISSLEQESKIGSLKYVEKIAERFLL